MKFRILGSLEAVSDGGRVPLGGQCERSVLAGLLLDAGRVVPVRRLAELAWDGDPPATAGKQVQNAVSRLRRALAGAGARDLVVTEAGGYRLAIDGCQVDAQVFEARVADAEVAASEGRTAQAAGLLRSALALWRGPALAGLAGRGIESAAAAWEERRLAAQEACYDCELALGRHREVLGELAGLAAASPFREKLAGQYMLALYRCGRQADALAAYRATQVLLADEMGLDPGPELRELQRQILTADPALAPPARAGQPPLAAHGPAARLAGGETGLGAVSDALDQAGEPAAGGMAAAALAAAPGLRHSLPPDTAAFTGRGDELAAITARVTGAAQAGSVIAIHAIGGMPGVGKTALAVHAAHQLRDQFPDRQLFIDLHAHTPGQDPVLPGTALAGLLTAIGVDARNLPGDIQARADLWRDQMAGQRALLVLDNAASTAQVAPLLPGAEGCLVLVTSRRHLGDLPGSAVPVPLDALPPGQAQAMFARLAPRARQDPGAVPAVAELARLAGYLPLAISLLARVHARHSSWTLADLTRETRASLLTLAAENDTIIAAFDLSYRYLDPGRRRFFRRLGLHPGTSIDAYAAAALAGVPLAQARAQLDALHGEGLLTETGYRRYGMHDLIRRYARDRARADPADGRDQALERLLDYYQHAAARAEALLARQARPGPAAPCAPPATVPRLADHAGALAWARAERGNLIACLDHATAAGQHGRVIALTAGLAVLLRQDGPWADAVPRHATAVQAAQRLGDRPGEASALTSLGTMRRLTGDYPAAAQNLGQALGIYRDLGDRPGEASALANLGDVRSHTSDYPAAAQNLEQALGIYRDLGDRLGQASALNDLGDVRRLTGDCPAAAQILEQALGIYRDLGNRPGQADALTNLGDLRRLTGDYPASAQILGQALGIYRDLGDRLGQASALAILGDVRRLTGDYPAAAQNLGQALGIYRDLGNRVGQASTLTYLGIVRRMTGEHLAAARDLEQALDICRDLGDRGAEATVLNETGTLHQVSGDPVRAERCYQQALELARAIPSTWDEAHALAGLGRCAIAAGRTEDGREDLRQAHEIYRQIGAAETAGISNELQ